MFRLPTAALPPLGLLALLVGACDSSASDSQPPQDDASDVQAPDDPDDPSLDTTDSEPLPPGPAVTPRSLPLVRAEQGRLVDSVGREVVFRGINARVAGLFDVTFDDGRTALQPIPDFDADDAAQMAAAGFNLLRLPINWSGLEPQEGQFSATYLTRLDEVIALANDAGLYVLVDFHQDAWSKEIGEDGAPLWAIVPPPRELLQGPLTDLARRRTSAQVMDAFRGFFENREGIRDRFLPVWRLVTARYADRDGVVGFQPMNEPVVSHIDNGDALLWEFYEVTAREMRVLNARHALWVEPDALRNFTLRTAIRPTQFPDNNVVYAPHMYPNFIGMNHPTTEAWVNALTRTFDAIVAEAEPWGGATVIGEWGRDPRDANAGAYARAIDTLTAQRGFGHATWLWKEDSQDSWGFFDFDAATGWTERPGTLETIVVPYAQAVPGRVLQQTWDEATRTLSVTFVAQTFGAAPLVFAPPERFGGSVDARLDEASVGMQYDETNRRALVAWDGQTGTRTLRLSPGD